VIAAWLDGEGIENGVPFLISPNGHYDTDLNAYAQAAFAARRRLARLVEHRRDPGTVRLPVLADSHVRHRLHGTHALTQAPPKDPGLPGRQKGIWPCGPGRARGSYRCDRPDLGRRDGLAVQAGGLVD
jgi:hypothetical protein